MKLYQSHKRVEAAKIVTVNAFPGHKQVQLLLEGGVSLVVSTDWLKHFEGNNEDPGYYVQYLDGYESWSSTQAFEEGYTLCTPNQPPLRWRDDEEKPLTQRQLEIVRSLLKYSWDGINRVYEDLTEKERTLLTAEEFDQLCAWVYEHHKLVPQDSAHTFGRNQEQQRPSIGRIVHYTSRGSKDGVYKPEVRAAIVTKVGEPGTLGENTVDVFVINPSGLFFDQMVGYAETPTPGCWSWPPRN